MKTGMIVSLVLAGAAPVAVYELDADHNGGDLMGSILGRAEEIAKRDYAQSAQLEVVRTWEETTRMGAFGETIRADPGQYFAHARVSIHNTGKMDLAVSLWHFIGVDELGEEHPALLGGAHDDFNAGRLRGGGTMGGTVAFDLPKGSYLTQIVWQGDLASAVGDVPTEAPPVDEIEQDEPAKDPWGQDRTG